MCVSDTRVCIAGDRYFTCAMGAGSFISPAKLTKGLPFAEAVLRKYTDDRERPHIAVNAAYLLRREHGDSGAFLNLQNVDMSEWPITRAGAFPPRAICHRFLIQREFL